MYLHIYAYNNDQVLSPGTPEVPGHDGRRQEDHGHSAHGARPREAADGSGGREDEGRRSGSCGGRVLK